MKNRLLSGFQTCTAPSWENIPLLLTPAETSALLGCSTDVIFSSISSGKMPSVVVGKRKRIPREFIQKLVEQSIGGSTTHA